MRNSCRLPLIFCLLCAGCVTPYDAASQDSALLARQARLREDLASLSTQISSLRAKQEEYDHRLESRTPGHELKTAVEECGARVDTLEDKLNTVQENLERLDTEWRGKMEAVIEVVKSENARLRQSLEQLQKSAVASGWEHTVSPGETLAEIAKAYGVELRAIVEANDISDPDKIRVGRTLFIPQ